MSEIELLYGYSKLECIRKDWLHSGLPIEGLRKKHAVKPNKVQKVLDWCIEKTLELQKSTVFSNGEVAPIETEDSIVIGVHPENKDYLITIGDLSRMKNPSKFLIDNYSL